MMAKISTSTLFDGKVYARGRPNSCVMDIRNSTEFEITLPYNDVNCDVVQDGPATFSSNIVIQVRGPPQKKMKRRPFVLLFLYSFFTLIYCLC